MHQKLTYLEVKFEVLVDNFRKGKNLSILKRNLRTADIYQRIMNSLPNQQYKFSQLRIAYCILLSRVLEWEILLPLRMDDLQSLLEFG